MEPNKIQTLAEFKKHAAWHFSMLKPDPKLQAVYSLEIKVTGYSDMLALASNLVKMCVLTVQTEEPHMSDLIKHPFIDIGSVLELVLQLIPHGESELLDVISQMVNTPPENQNNQTNEQ